MPCFSSSLRSKPTPRTLFSHARNHRRPSTSRFISTTRPHRSILGSDRITHWSKDVYLPRGYTPTEKTEMLNNIRGNPNRIKVYPCPVPSARAACKDPLEIITKTQLAILDPTGVRQKLFEKTNIEGVKVGDILLVKTRDGDPVSGVCINIRRQGIDTAILLRNNVTRVSFEIWLKIYSPNVTGIEVVQKRAKRARRARLYYMRKPKHDIGSVQNLVQAYQRQRQAIRSGGNAAHGGHQKSSRKKPRR